tara:strand:- start:1605 stop:2183 length:579 start_codon:yes stop_codon:yes gene_type:complete
MEEIFFVFLCSYFLGSIPFGLFLSKIFLKKDIRKSGSGNIGATNVFRAGGKFLSLLTLLLDGAKGYLAVFFTSKYSVDYLILSSLIVFIGHLFPVWLKFRGGKGVATYIGILFAFDLFFPFVFVIIWTLIILITKYASVASLISTAVVFIFSVFLKGVDQSLILFIFLILIIFTHRGNIWRLKSGTEEKINL